MARLLKNALINNTTQLISSDMNSPPGFKITMLILDWENIGKKRPFT